MLLHSTYYQEPDTFSREQTTAGAWRTRRRPHSSLPMGEKFLLAPIRRCPDTCPRRLPPSPPSSRPCTRVGSLQTRGLAASQTTAPGSYLDGSLKRNRHFLLREETFRRTTWRVKKKKAAEWGRRSRYARGRWNRSTQSDLDSSRKSRSGKLRNTRTSCSKSRFDTIY